MSSGWKAGVSGLLVTSAILLIALVISTPNGVTLLLAIAIGFVVGLATWYQDRR